MGKVFHRFRLEVFHTLRVVVRLGKVEPLFLKVDALGVRLLCVVGKLRYAVEQAVYHLSLVQLGKEHLYDVPDIFLDLARERVRCQDEGNTGLYCRTNLGNINFDFNLSHTNLLNLVPGAGHARG